MRIKQLLQRIRSLNGYVLILLVLGLIICIRNYQAGTWLSGWDNLHPEFNYGLAIQRAFYGIWQSNQGLGIVAGLAHAADLIRLIVLAAVGIIVQAQNIRWLYIFTMLLAGPLGMFNLVRKFPGKSEHSADLRLVAFAAAAFYLLNLGTVQIFALPLETYAAMYAFFPWLIWSYLNYLQTPVKENLLKLILINCLSATMSTTPTAIFGYGVFLGLLTIQQLWKSRQSFKRVVIALTIILVSNLFWLLPTVYALPGRAEELSLAKINQMFSEDIRSKNERRSSWEDFVVLRGFLFDVTEVSSEQTVEFVLADWREHLDQPVVFVVGVVTFLIILIGLLGYILKPRRYKLPVIVSFVLVSVMLLGPSAPFAPLYNLFNSVPILNEAFRFTYLKFIFLAVFVFSLLFSEGVIKLTRVFITSKRSQDLNIGSRAFEVLLLLFPLILVTLPMFSGGLFYRDLKVKYPDQYFQLFQWFQTQDTNKKIATYPLYSFAGWHYYTWGYRGSGFLWYGIAQPILDRNFDHWSSANESFYLEFDRAIQNRDQAAVLDVLNKYNVSYILADHSEYAPGIDSKPDWQWLETLDLNQESIVKANQIADIYVYEYKQSGSMIKTVDNPAVVNEQAKFKYTDSIYKNAGDYIVSSKPQTIYPFNSLEERSLDIREIEGDKYLVSAELPLGEYKLNGAPSSLYVVQTDSHYQLTGTSLVVYKSGTRLAIKLQAINSWVPASLSSDKTRQITKDPWQSGSASSQLNSDGSITYIANDANIFDSLTLGGLSHKNEYLIYVPTQNISGRNLRVYMQNTYSAKVILSNKLGILDYIYLPQQPDTGDSYQVNLQNTSYNFNDSTNTLKEIEVYSLPQNILGFSLTTGAITGVQTTTYMGVVNITPISYLSSVAENADTIILQQHYDRGWQAYGFTWNPNFINRLLPFTGKELTKHYLANGWSNGWDTEGSTFVVMVYTPQLLQIIGLISLISIIGILIRYHKGIAQYKYPEV